MEMVAQSIEVTSVAASGKRLKDPVKVPRPKWFTNRFGAGAAPALSEEQPSSGNPYTAAITRLMATTPRRRRRG